MQKRVSNEEIPKEMAFKLGPYGWGSKPDVQ